MQELFFQMIGNPDIAATLLNRAGFLLPVLDSNSQGKAQLLYGPRVSAAFEAQNYFLALIWPTLQVALRKLSFMQNAVNCTLTGMAVQLAHKSRVALTKSFSLGPLGIVITQICDSNLPLLCYRFYHCGRMCFVSVRQAVVLFRSRPPLLWLDGAAIIARDRWTARDQLVLSYSMSESLRKLVLNNSLYTFRNAWTELEKLRLQRRSISLLFTELPEFVTKALKITRLRPLSWS